MAKVKRRLFRQKPRDKVPRPRAYEILRQAEKKGRRAVRRVLLKAK